MDKMSKLGFNLKTRRSALRCVLALVLCLAMVTGFLPMPGMSALAAGNDIVVKFETDTAKEAGLQLSLYRVGDCENGDFHLYAESGVTLNSDEEDTDKIKAAVDELAAWAVSAQEPVRGPVAVDGKEVSFTGLDVGTYLIMPAGDHPTVNMQPSLVSLLGTKTVDAKIEEAVQVVVEKEWDEKDLTSLLDSESSITVQLFADDALYTAADGSYVEKTLPDTDSDGNLLWSYKQGNLPKYNKEKNEVKYEWREVETTIPTGYKLVSQETDDDTHTTTITNERETIDATVVKTWVHGTNAEDNYPTSIDVTLWKTVGGETTAVKTITLPVDGKWEYTESNLPLYEKTEEGTAKVTYKWTEDLDTIKVNGEALKEDENGNAYHQVEYNHDESTEGTVVDTYTNKYTDKTSYTITKTWDDASNQDGKRPDKIKVQLYYKVGDGAEKAYDKEPYNEPVELPADKDTVSYTWYGLETKEGEQDIVYSAKELDTDSLEKLGYTSSFKAETATITNTHTPETVQFTVQKKWVDTQNRELTGDDAANLPSVTLRLYHGDASVTTSYTLPTEDGKWELTTEELPKYKEGKEIGYYWAEDDSASIGDYDANKPYIKGVVTSTDGGATFTATNTRRDYTSVSVAKVWRDAGNFDGIRPDSIDVQLLIEGSSTVLRQATIQAGEDGAWEYTFENLEKYDSAGNEIKYTVREIVPSGYNDFLSGNASQGFTFINTHEPALGSLTIIKSVTVNNQDPNGSQDADGVYSFRISGPNGYSQSVSISIVGGRSNSVTLNNLTPGIYTVTENEEGLWAGVQLISGNGDVVVPANGTGLASFVNNIDVTPTPTPEITPTPTATPEQTPSSPTPTPLPTVSIEGEKVWDDNGNEHGVRPASVTVQVVANGVPTGNSATWTSTSGDTWSFRFDGLPAIDAAGQAISYTLYEVPVEGYITGVVGNTIINTLIPRTPEKYEDIDGEKIWLDGGNANGNRPNYITVHLLRGGVEVDSRVVTAATNWQYRFENMPVDDGYGHVYEYTVKEDPVPGYYTRVTGTSVTNGEIPNKPDIPSDMTEEKLENLVDLFDYDTPLFGRPLGTGDELPIYPFVFAGIGLTAVLVLLLGRRRKKSGG